MFTYTTAREDQLLVILIFFNYRGANICTQVLIKAFLTFSVPLINTVTYTVALYDSPETVKNDDTIALRNNNATCADNFTRSI